MIFCDNDDCPIQWFHTSCLKMKRVPKGKWFCPHKFADSFVEEPICNGRFPVDCCRATGTTFWVVSTNEMSQFRPLVIGSTVREEDSGHSQHVHHCDETTSLLEPVLLSSAKGAGIMHHPLAELFSSTVDHASQFVK